VRPVIDTALSAREQILEAAAALFAEAGVAATTTRAIADRVGMRQASLYYHFASKDEILLELLSRSVRPSLEYAMALLDVAHAAEDPAGGLYALALRDVRTLADAPHNIASLYLMPEVQQPQYDEFRAERSELQAVYGRLASSVSGQDAALMGALVMQLVESVIPLRRDGVFDEGLTHPIAEAVLRTTGLAAPDIARARKAAGPLSAALAEIR
jgi:AcrR family transcriptional regulator